VHLIHTKFHYTENYDFHYYTPLSIEVQSIYNLVPIRIISYNGISYSVESTCANTTFLRKAILKIIILA